jgi:glutamate carboxypeptidase
LKQPWSNTVTTARRASSWTLNVTAKLATPGFLVVILAMVLFMNLQAILNDFRLQLSQEKYLTFNPGLIVGGSEMNYDADAKVMH